MNYALLIKTIYVTLATEKDTRGQSRKSCPYDFSKCTQYSTLAECTRAMDLSLIKRFCHKFSRRSKKFQRQQKYRIVSGATNSSSPTFCTPFTTTVIIGRDCLLPNILCDQVASLVNQEIGNSKGIAAYCESFAIIRTTSSVKGLSITHDKFE